MLQLIKIEQISRGYSVDTTKLQLLTNIRKNFQNIQSKKKIVDQLSKQYISELNCIFHFGEASNRYETRK